MQHFKWSNMNVSLTPFQPSGCSDGLCVCRLTVMLLCAVVSSINIWLAVAEYCSECVLASLIWKYVCLGGYLKGFSPVAEVSHHDTFSESSEQHISGIVSIIRRHTDTPAFHFLIVFSESQRPVMAL